MTFYERYSELCVQMELEPCSQKAADTFKTTRATISTWKKTGAIPRGETVKLIADTFTVSTDYLLGRTDDPTDHTTKGPATHKFQPTIQKDLAYKHAIDLYKQLDSVDRMRVESYMEGILGGGKYNKKKADFA